ncbi:hypothetical protein [Vibrio metschnikovii]|uniref:hypothetical protein n=1 Tax=Vibrio metschnikovii TaxID=28172 RepID=UPI001302C596|nr:hypothetical protein [Vibrio metschnikovii]EKO3708946.1 hypothetical protein [Vibrio metschnikovii]
MDKVLSYVNQIMDRADSFNYFVFLSTFVIFLDGILLYAYGISIFELNFSYIKSNITIGSFLVFLCVYSLFMAVIVTGLKFVISQIVLSLPTIEFLQHPDNRNFRQMAGKDYVTISQMRTYAIKNDNSVALGVVAEKHQETRNLYNLEKNCFAFLLASLLSLVVGFDGNPSLVVSLFNFTEDGNVFSFENLKTILVSVVYITMVYIGVIRGCSFQITPSLYRDRIYFPDNDIKN